jgi:hypothetical protein
MTRLRIISFFIFFCCSASLMGQGRYETYYTVGPVIKVVQSTFRFENDQVNIPESEPEIGYELGGFLRVRVNDLYVQPELLLSKTQNQLVFLNYDGVTGFNPKADFEFTSIDIPVAIGYFFNNFRIESGPAISILLEGQQFFLNEKTDIKDDFNNVSLQYHVGIGFDLNDALININYEFGLSKAGESLRRFVGSDFRPSRSNLVFSVALALHRHKKRQ